MARVSGSQGSVAPFLAKDLTDYLDFNDRIAAAIAGGLVEPVFSPDGASALVDGCLVNLETGAKTPAPEDQVLTERQQRAAPRKVRGGFYAADPGPDEVPSPDGTLLLGEIGPNLALRAIVDDRHRPLTSDGVDDVPWSVEGAAWSADSERVIATRKDTRACSRLVRIAWLQGEEQLQLHPYTRSGGALPTSTAAVIDVRSRRVLAIELPGERDQTITPAGWRHDGTEAYVMTTDRRQKYLRLHAVDAATGASRLVCEEVQDTFIHGIRQLPRFAPAMILDDDERILWLSERDGWRHLYLYRTDGAELGRVTSGEFEVLKVLGVDRQTETVYLTAHADTTRPYDVHICRVGLDGSGFSQLTTVPGLHDAVLTPRQTHLVDRHSALHRPPVTELLTVDGTLVSVLGTSDESAVAALGLGTAEEFTVLAADDATVLHGVLYLPPDFKPSRSYPLIEAQYGGPQTSVHQVGFTEPFADSGLTPTGVSLAKLGFVACTIDGRGTPDRGKAFQDVVYGRFGAFCVEDHVHALRQLLERYEFIDGDRIGVTGGSWGGYNTVRCLLLAPDLYKVGVALCPVYDLDDHNAFPIEPYMGLPIDRPEAFAAASSVAIADRLQGKLLMIHGSSDVNATFSATMRMCDALARAAKPYDLIVIPEADHLFKNVGVEHWRYKQTAIARYFLEHLGVPE